MMNPETTIRQQDDAKLARLASEFGYAALLAEFASADEQALYDLVQAANLERSHEGILADSGHGYFNDAKHAA